MVTRGSLGSYEYFHTLKSNSLEGLAALHIFVRQKVAKRRKMATHNGVMLFDIFCITDRQTDKYFIAVGVRIKS